MDLYKIKKKIEGKWEHIGNVRAESPMRAKIIYAKQSGLSVQDYKLYKAEKVIDKESKFETPWGDEEERETPFNKY